MKKTTYMSSLDVPPPVKARKDDPHQGGLFDVQPRARTSDPETSHEAARSMKASAGTHRKEILDYLRHNGGATGDGIDEALGWRHATANRRLPELRELGLVEMTEDKAVTRSGRQARIWRIV